MSHSLADSQSKPQVPAETPPPNPASSPPTDFYRSAVLNAGIAVALLDPTAQILVWNPAAVLLFGRSEADALGRTFESLIPRESRASFTESFQRTIQQRSVNFYELAFIPEGGKSQVHVGITLNSVLDATGNLLGAVAWMRNITNRKVLEDHLTRTRHMASIGTLAAGVAHHFNNIAAGMSTMVDFALATEDQGAMLKALRMSAEACTRISYITQSLLACSAESDPSEHPERSDFTEELLRFADAVIPTLDKKGIALDLDLQARRHALVPRVRFGQVLHHLLRNAEDAIEDRVSRIPDAECRITLRSLIQADHIMLQFSDTGCGIEPENLRDIFEPFFTRKGVHGGGDRANPGLGLTLVRTVLLEMNGSVWADSIPGQGTTFNLHFPIIT